MPFSPNCPPTTTATFALLPARRPTLCRRLSRLHCRQRPGHPEEYRDLFQELERRGYNLVVKQRATPKCTNVGDGWRQNGEPRNRRLSRLRRERSGLFSMKPKGTNTMTKPDVAEYEFAPPLVAEEDGYQVSEVSVQEFDDGDCYDLFDQSLGTA